MTKNNNAYRLQTLRHQAQEFKTRLSGVEGQEEGGSEEVFTSQPWGYLPTPVPSLIELEHFTAELEYTQYQLISRQENCLYSEIFTRQLNVEISHFC